MSKSPKSSSKSVSSIYIVLSIFAIILMAMAMGATAISITKVSNPSPVSASTNKSVSQNFLVVIMDDVGTDMIGAYHEWSSPANTPTINQLAAEGVLFRNVYSNPLCTPTRAGVQTGRYAFHTGVGGNINFDNNGYTLYPSELILPEMLKLGTNGKYSTALFGKWHLANQVNGGEFSPNVMGYDYYAGHLSNLSSAPGDNYFKWDKTVNGVTSQKTGYITTDTVDDAIAWTSQQSTPWLAVVAFQAPHAPYHVPPANLHTVPSPNTSALKYKAMLEALDTELGRLLLALRQSGQYANTTIIVMGDNGTPTPASSNPLHSKGTVYEGGINVPFIVKSPLVRVPGESAAFVQTLDIFSTIAEIAGVNVGPITPPGVKIDSISFVSYLKNPSSSSIRPYGFSELFGPIGAGHGSVTPPPVVSQSLKAMRDVRYKLIADYVNQTEEFYDLLVDPLESQNLLVNGLAPGSPEELAYLKFKTDINALVGS